MKVAYIMQNYSAVSELWLQRQLQMLKDDVSFIASIDNQERYWNNEIPVVNLYSDYSFLKKILIKLKILRVRTPQERYNDVLRKALAANCVDVIFVNYLTLAYDLKEVLLSTKIPIFIHTHGYDITWNLLSISTGKMIYTDAYFKFVRDISRKSVLIANSRDSKNRLLRIGVSDDNILIKRFGVSIEGLGLNNNKESIKILYLGRLIDFKRPDLVIKAFEKACDKGLKGELIIAGGGYLETTCKLLQKESKYRDKIKLLGVVSSEEGKKLRRECDIFTVHNCKGILTNQCEAFGVSIIEAMSAGMPVVTGRSGGVVDSVVDRETGFLFTPGNVNEHADRLLELAQNDELRVNMGKKGIERVKQYFSLEGEKKFLITMLNSVL